MTKVYFYWVVFFVRQRHSLSHDYREWSEEDKNIWKKELLKDSDIITSMKYISEKEVKQYARKYAFQYWIKHNCKKIGGIA